MNVISRARELRKMIEKASAGLDVVDATNSVELFPKYDETKEYQTGDRFRVGEHLYQTVNYDGLNVSILCRR